MEKTNSNLSVEERVLSLKTKGWAMVWFWLLFIAACGMLAWFIVLGVQSEKSKDGLAWLWWTLTSVAGAWLCLGAPIVGSGFKIIKPSEARVLTLFGKYYGSLKSDGIYYVNPFCSEVSVPVIRNGIAQEDAQPTAQNPIIVQNKRLSLKIMTLLNDKQKINDALGNPLIIGMVVTWRVVDTAKAMFAVENFADFLSLNCDSAVRDTVKQYPYDSNDDDEKSLRGSSEEIAARLKADIQRRVQVAGLEIIEARITNLSYSPEIAAAMLQRQQASAMVDARALIVEGAVGMVQLALAKLKSDGVVELDEERKAAMVSNLMVVLCGDKGAQPIVNSGSLY
jgi:regulator of protease activity HflC (stomatin/prohibitin superfamily)